MFFVGCMSCITLRPRQKKELEKEKIVEEQGKMHDGLQNTQKTPTYNLLFEISKFLSKSHGAKEMERLINGKYI